MFELRDAIRHLDDETDYKYDLVGMYEATELSEPEKKLIAAMIADAKDPEEIAGELFKIFNTQNALNIDEDCEPNKELKEQTETLDDFLKDAEVILVDDAESFDINAWEKQTDEEMSEELNQKVEEARADSRYVKYKLEDADIDKLVEKIKTSSINIVDYWKTKQFLKKRGLEKNDLDDVIHNLSKDDYIANSKSVDNARNEAVIFVKDSKINELGPFNMYIKLDYDSVEETPVIIISIHETRRKELNKKVEKTPVNHEETLPDKSQGETNTEALAVLNDCIDEALHGMNEVEQFVKMADAIGLKTMSDVKDFLEREGEGKDILTALYDYLHNEIGDLGFHAKDESLKENAGKSEWEEVASKSVEDSDGFMADYVWYTDGNKHVFIFGDSDIYRPEDGDFDWEIDVVEGKEAESYKEAQDWFDSYNGFAEEDLNEAQDVFDIQGQAVRDSKRKEVLDEFKELFETGENGEVNIDTEETLEYVRGFLEDQGYTVTVSQSTNAEHPIHIEWFK